MNFVSQRGFTNAVLPSRQMKEALSEIIQLATVDSEPWVLMVADILKSFPETGSLNLDLEEQNPNVQDILGELREKGLFVHLAVHENVFVAELHTYYD